MNRPASRTPLTAAQTRRPTAWSSQRGSFDLSSIVVGAVVLGILAAGVLTTVFGVIPWAQDEQAKQNLSAVRTAEGTHATTDKGFVDLAGLQAAKYLPTPADRVTVDADPSGACYLAVAKSQSGKIFYSTDKFNDAREMTPTTTASPGTTVVPCLPAATVQDLVDDTGGYEPEAFKPIGDGSGTTTDPGITTKSTSATEVTVPANKDVTTGEVTITDRTLEVTFQNTSSSPTTARYAGRVTCYDPSRNSTTVEDVDGYFDLNSNIYADMTLVLCSPGTQPVDVEFRPFDVTYSGSGGTSSGVHYRWRAPVRYTQATWVTRGLTASYNGQWCIENKDNAATEGNPVFLAPCAKVDAQRWQWNGDGEIRQSSLDHKCAAAVNDKVVLSACAAPGQQFKAEVFQGENKTGGLIQMVHTASGKCVDIPGGALASVQLGLAACNGTSTQSWYMPGLAGNLAQELQQPEIIDPEPMTPVSDTAAAGMEMVMPNYSPWRPWYADRTVTDKTTSGFRIMFGLNGATNSANYDVKWSGAALNATGIVLPATTTPTSYGSPQITFYGDVTAAPGGFKEGTGYVTATVTEKATGKTTVKSWKITVNPLAIVAPTSLTNWDKVYWVDRTTTEKTNDTRIFALAINNAAASDFTTTWSGGAKINAAPGATTISFQGAQSVHYSSVGAGPGGFIVGSDTITATVRHNATGTVMTKTWTITVNPVAIVAPTSLTNWDKVYWVDWTTTEKTSTARIFALAINHAAASDYTTTWAGGSRINAAPGANNVSYQGGAQSIHYSSVGAGPGGFISGTDTITATVRHNATGTVLTKTWTITVNPVAIVAPTSLTNWDKAYWLDRTSTELTTGGLMFALGINNAASADFTTTWTGGSKVNAAPGANTVSVQGNQAVHYATFAAGPGGFTAGTDTVTATVRHNASGSVMTKSWTITVNPAAIVAPTSLTGWASAYWVDRTVATGSTTNVMFAFGIQQAKLNDFTVTWSGGSEVNAAPLAGSYSDQSSQGVYYSNIKPGPGGFTAGTSTITATATHAASGKVMTKTWTLTVK